jgi:hypothetical protein
MIFFSLKININQSYTRCIAFLFASFSFALFVSGCRRPILQDWRIQRAGGGEREGITSPYDASSRTPSAHPDQ